MLDKKYNFHEKEKKWQDFWEANNIYEFDPTSKDEVFSIDTPPPTVSGELHIGHIFSYTQAEIIARFHRMMGKNVFYPFGFDDNGLPTERLVEKEEGLRAKDLPRSEFIKKCMNTTEKYISEFKGLWKSLGFSADWNLQYDTINPRVQKISQHSFLQLAKEGKAYLKEMPVLWCTSCQTSIAQAELEAREKESTFNWLSFKVENEEVIVATTRPELLFGCVCLFVHPEDERYRKYHGKEAIVPIYNYPIPILCDERVSIEKGTGAVMCATFGDTTDLEWYNAYGLPYRKVIEGNGCIAKDVPFIGGLKVEVARKKIIELLQENRLLLKSEAILHTTSVHERCGKEVEIIPSKQWYIDILQDKERYLQAAEEINWYPASMKIRYEAWVNNLKYDWCISRQRYFGIPFPVWYCKDCGDIHFAEDELLPVNPQEESPKEPCSCGCSDWIPEEAVMDTWATSSLTPLINARWHEDGSRMPGFIPMSLRTQGHEIIRTWTFYTIAKSIFHTGRIPWKNIMLSGFVMAKKGEKISKSKGNAASSPQVMIEKYSADALRYWTAGARLGSDTMFSEVELQASNRLLTKLWNAAKFSFIHLTDYNPLVMLDLEKMEPVDRWIMERSKETLQQAKEALRQYEFGTARHVIDTFFWNDFCDNYLEIVKDRLYKPEIYGIEIRRSAQKALYESFLNIIKLYAIFIPHITEEIYQDYYVAFENAISVHKLQWEKAEKVEKTYIGLGEEIKAILEEVRRYKSQRNVSLKTPLTRIEISASAESIALLKKTQKDFTACTSTGEMVWKVSAGGALEVVILE